MPSGYPYPQELRDKVAELYEQKLGIRKIARQLELPETTVRRWVYPEEAERIRVNSRRNKHKRAKQCAECGAKIWYTSVLCAVCSRAKQRRERYWTRERVIRAIQEWARINGKPPTASDWIRANKPHHPAVTAIYGYKDAPFRFWNDALEAAGFPRRPAGPGPGKSSWSKDEAHKLRAEGLSDKEIARRFGVSPSAIPQRIGNRPSPPVKAIVKSRTREQRISDLQQALANDPIKGEQDGNRNRAGDNHD